MGQFPFVTGRVGSGSGWTLRNYAELIEQAYAFYFWETFRIGFIISAIAVMLGAPLAWLAARTKRKGLRVAIFGTILLGIAITDVKHYLIPDCFTVSGLFWVLATAIIAAFIGADPGPFASPADRR